MIENSFVDSDFRQQYLKDIEYINYVGSLASSMKWDKKNININHSFIESHISKFKELNIKESIEYMFDSFCFHPIPFFRKYAIDLVNHFSGLSVANDAILILIHDTDDIVFNRAIKTAGERRIENSLHHLMPLIGPLSNYLETGIKTPVGVPHALVAEAMIKIYGTENISSIKEKGKKLFNDGAINPQSNITKKETPENINGMIKISKGHFISGINEENLKNHRLSYRTSIPTEEPFLDTYFIDEFPVTNREYDKFVEDIGDNDEYFKHPDQKDGKTHVRNTINDERFEDDHPVTGIDWYDAYAYAKWCGKELPTELQWEKAARGPEGNIFPWGNEFNSEFVNCYGEKEIDLNEWRQELCKTCNFYPSTTTYPINYIKENESYYGVKDMVGNNWEYTSTNFYSKQPMMPNFKDLDPTQFIEDEEGYPVLKGGAWSSIPDLVSCWYRGKDLLTDRHFEIGFRCVKNLY
ncbi:formylglycine-generating enzyme family protein [Salinicoccus sesuvii]|uniref:Formylglycine-generating enzyme family protein n=1 Tax=Salinicoccus sesuvii TaxID=868281 RepID=A0ABV7N545_9STAP